MPLPLEPEITAVATAIVTIEPTWRHIDLSDAMMDECSGASCNPALRHDGLMAPAPMPIKNVATISHKYGEISAIGFIANNAVPITIVIQPKYNGGL